jgi:hypothetical protein
VTLMRRPQVADREDTKETDMRIQQFSTFFLWLGIAVLPAFSQSALKVKIPFSFNVAEANLPAGEYVLSSSRGKVAIRDSRGRTNALALANEADRRPMDRIGRAIFDCYGDRCFLSRFWAAGQNEGNQLLRSRFEIKIAANETGAYFAVLGTTPPQ